MQVYISEVLQNVRGETENDWVSLGKLSISICVTNATNAMEVDEMKSWWIENDFCIERVCTWDASKVYERLLWCC